MLSASRWDSEQTSSGWTDSATAFEVKDTLSERNRRANSQVAGRCLELSPVLLFVPGLDLGHPFQKLVEQVVRHVGEEGTKPRGERGHDLLEPLVAQAGEWTPRLLLLAHVAVGPVEALAWCCATARRVTSRTSSPSGRCPQTGRSR